MRLGVIGVGYVGLVTGVCFASYKNTVNFFDVDTKKINQLKNKKIPIYEPGLQDLFLTNLDKINFNGTLEELVNDSFVILICVGTPARKDGSTNLKYINSVIKDLSKYNLDNKHIVIKSTVPVGTAKKLSKKLNGKSIISNPEFLREGCALEDFKYSDRIIIGCNSKEDKNIMSSLYKEFDTLLFMNNESAELVKQAANTFLATKISFINEIAYLCEKVGANIEKVSNGIGYDDRIGSKFLNAGISYGGSCLPKDVLGLISIGEKNSIIYNIR